MSSPKVDIFSGIFMRANSSGYRVQINHPEIHPLYKRYHAFKHIPPTQPLSDEERFEFEDYMVEHFTNIAYKYYEDELREVERIDRRVPPLWIRKQGDKYKVYRSFVDACADIPYFPLMARMGDRGMAASFEVGHEQYADTIYI